MSLVHSVFLEQHVFDIKINGFIRGRALLRTHTCGEIRPEHIDQTVTLSGWVDTYRDHSGVLFVDVRDRYGKTQVVFSPDIGEERFKLARTLRNEYVIMVTGRVAERPEGTENPKIPTGRIEVRADRLRLLNRSSTPPLLPTAQEVPTEEVRLRHRYLDLRRPAMLEVMELRHRVTKIIRDYFDELGFIDVETPILGRSTPEGARDFLVPSRIYPNHFYALPQSPQLYKQILMVAGFDRYFQIARCFRDEDQRADRQLEFTQVDLEMAFVEMDDIIEIMDGMIARLCREVLGKEPTLPLPRLEYHEAMERFGHDAPDLRFGMEIVDLTDLAAQVDFRVFRSVADSGGRVRGINAKGAADRYSRKDIDLMTDWVREDFGAKGLAWFKVDDEGELTGPIAKNFQPEVLRQIAERLEAEAGDFLLFSADQFEVTCKTLNGLRRRLGAELKLFDPGEMHFSWVTHFPMFERDEEEGGLAAMHHPFTAPLDEDLPHLDGDPTKLRAKAYDLVINGFEAGGGTIRIHDAEVQSKIFDILGIDSETADERFGFLLDALQFGAPPHGGIAFGLDRLVMLFGGLSNIRECIAFPKTARAQDLMTAAPGEVDAKQLQELSIKSTVLPKTKEQEKNKKL